MFPDSEIAKCFTLGETKCNYFATFGLGQYFSDKVKADVNNTNHYVLLFDESLNDQLQQKQMDVHVRFWEGSQVCLVIIKNDTLYYVI